MSLYEKLKNHPIGMYADLIDGILYTYSRDLEKISVPTECKSRFGGRNTAQLLRDIAGILEGIAFKDFREEAAKEHAWIKELQAKDAGK